MMIKLSMHQVCLPSRKTGRLNVWKCFATTVCVYVCYYKKAKRESRRKKEAVKLKRDDNISFLGIGNFPLIV